jgi:hypothetical protein
VQRALPVGTRSQRTLSPRAKGALGKREAGDADSGAPLSKTGTNEDPGVGSP